MYSATHTSAAIGCEDEDTSTSQVLGLRLCHDSLRIHLRGGLIRDGVALRTLVFLTLLIETDICKSKKRNRNIET